jgi:hypothetical protein
VPSLLGLFASAATVLAVPNIEDHTKRFDAGQLEQWRTHLTARIVESKRYRVAAAANIREQLAQIKAASFAVGFDEKRRADAGRELPARRVLDVQLFNSGGSCAVIASLYDLERAVAVDAYTSTNDCSAEQMQRGFDEVASAITGEPIPEPPEPVDLTPSTPWPVSTELVLFGMGYGGTIGGATGPIAAAELFTIKYGPLRATLIDAGTTIFASKGEVFEEIDHSMLYVGATAGAALTFGAGDRHELRLSGGPALYRAAADEDFFTGLKPNADETDGLTPAVIADARYVFHMTEGGPMGLGFGGGLRAVVPLSALHGDPRLVMLRLFVSFGAL